jgi:hypothetical protein
MILNIYRELERLFKALKKLTPTLQELNHLPQESSMRLCIIPTKVTYLQSWPKSLKQLPKYENFARNRSVVYSVLVLYVVIPTYQK